MPAGSKPRRGVTLLELLVVATLMGILSSTVIARYGRDVFGDLGARSTAQRIATELLRAQQMAIRTGQPHALVFTGPAGGPWPGCQIERITTSGAAQKKQGTPVTELVEFPAELQVTGTSSSIEFNFEGQSTAAATLNLSGPHRRWQIGVIPLSGAVTTTEIK